MQETDQSVSVLWKIEGLKITKVEVQFANTKWKKKKKDLTKSNQRLSPKEWKVTQL